MQINPKLYSWQIIHNPNAFLHRSNQYWKNIESRIKEVQIDHCYHVTSTIEEAKELIINLCKKGERHYMIIGGDGSLNIFVNAVMESQIDSSEIFAALIPLGTGNDWSRSHGYSRSYLEAIDSLMKGNFINHDVGLVETIIKDQVINTRYFVNIAGFGFDGAVIANASKKTTKYFHKQLYLINLLKTLMDYKPQQVTFQSNVFSGTKNIFSVAAGICQYNGNGMRQCPEAVSNDGLLDVVIIEKISIPKVLLNIRNLFDGSHVEKMKEVSVQRTDYLEINTAPHIPGEVEGEMLTTGDYRIRCLPSAINLMYANDKLSLKETSLANTHASHLSIERRI